MTIDKINIEIYAYQKSHKKLCISDTLSKHCLNGKGNCTSLGSPNAVRAIAAPNQLLSQLRETPMLRAVALATRG